MSSQQYILSPFSSLHLYSWWPSQATVISHLFHCSCLPVRGLAHAPAFHNSSFMWQPQWSFKDVNKTMSHVHLHILWLYIPFRNSQNSLPWFTRPHIIWSLTVSCTSFLLALHCNNPYYGLPNCHLFYFLPTEFLFPLDIRRWSKMNLSQLSQTPAFPAYFTLDGCVGEFMN